MTPVAPLLLAAWTSAHNGALIVVLAAFGLWRMLRPPARALSLDAQPLLPGEARWVVARDGTVLDSCVSESETGIANGWAVDHHISEWAEPGTPEAGHYRAAIEDRQPRSFPSSHVAKDRSVRHSRVTLMPRSDGTVYCESWDVTEEVLRADAAEARAKEAEERYEHLRKYVGDGFEDYATRRLATAPDA